MKSTRKQHEIEMPDLDDAPKEAPPALPTGAANWNDVMSSKDFKTLTHVRNQLRPAVFKRIDAVLESLEPEKTSRWRLFRKNPVHKTKAQKIGDLDRLIKLAFETEEPTSKRLNGLRMLKAQVNEIEKNALSTDATKRLGLDPSMTKGWALQIEATNKLLKR